MAVLLWFVFTGLLALYLSVGGSSLGRTYGPLTGLIAILLWTFLTSLALYLGASSSAFAAATRALSAPLLAAGSPAPRSWCSRAGLRGLGRNCVGDGPGKHRTGRWWRRAATVALAVAPGGHNPGTTSTFAA
ncbi:MAG TPA: hypothetical protein VFA45_10185 [Actinomycetes bacterium]|jgi:hypothetical protein|nr:hypothetical protein [Actinomycetes bacterium]